MGHSLEKIATRSGKRPYSESKEDFYTEKGRDSQNQLKIQCFWVPAQWVDATLACSLYAGVLNPKVSLGR
jgi:hypothetical protein